MTIKEAKLERCSSAITLLVTTLATFAAAQLPTALAQGSLTPPGPPAPAMKTLDQVEPRTLISAVPFAITNPGSYYLVSNLNLTVNSNAITISANDVTLDLRGFTLGTTVMRGSGTAILLNGGNTDITILNGHITGGNFAYLGSGINYSGQSPANVEVANVSVAECASFGINLGTNGSTLVEGCTMQSTSGYGIEAGVIRRSTAYQCGNTAVIANVVAADCSGASVNGDGVLVNGTALNCYGYSSGTGDGLSAVTAENCHGYSTGGYNGIYATTANGCYGFCDSGTGLTAISANNSYGTSNSGTGLFAQVAIGCYGLTYGSAVGDFGVNVNYIALGCVGISYSTYSLSAYIANSCYGNNTVNYTYHYNMPP